jgi:hypothetical protein
MASTTTAKRVDALERDIDVDDTCLMAVVANRLSPTLSNAQAPLSVMCIT